MVNRNLVGKCGLYCGACGIYRAYKDGGEYRQRLADFFKCPQDARAIVIITLLAILVAESGNLEATSKPKMEL